MPPSHFFGRRHFSGFAVQVFAVLFLSVSLFGQTRVKTQVIQLPASEAWSQWVGQHLPSANSEPMDPQTKATSLNLARARKNEMLALIAQNPEEFVRHAMPADERAKLPADLQPMIEQRIKQRGFFGVYCQGVRPDEPMGTNHPAPHGDYGYEVRLNGVTHPAYVFGKWKDQPTVLDADIEGVMLDDAIAIGDAPTPTEQSASGGAVSSASPTVSGPNTMLYMIARFSDQTSDPIDEATVLSQMGVVSTFWMNNSSGTVYLKGLVNGTQVVDIVHITLPQPASYGSTYNGNFSQLLSDARSAASALGYNYANYNLDVVVTTSGGFSYAGRSYIGAQGSHWVTPYTTLRTAGHELGHNLGLYHANYWRSDSTQPFGKDSNPGGYVADVNNGEWVEYGDYFSVMSAQYGGESDDATKPHYNPVEKVQLGWLSGNKVQYVTNSGTYRLFRLDARTTVGTPRGLRIETPATDYTGYGRRYWLGYRCAPWNTAQDWCQNGVSVNVCQTSYGSDGSTLLDMSPYSSDQASPFFDANNKPGSWWTIDNSDKLDSALIVGRTYDDTPAGIHITPVAKGSNGTGEEYLDVVINLGTFAGNHSPQITTFSASTNQTGVDQPVNFTLTASDPDGDSLAYSWDFDDGQTWTASGLNSPAAAKSWSSPGQHHVTARVSDMKGGVATASLVVTVGTSVNTNMIYGRVVWAGQPVYGARISTPTGAQAWTDSDGSYVLPGLAPNTDYTLNCAAAGLTFTPQFANPITLSAGNVYGADFYANEPLSSAIGGISFGLSGQVTSGSSGVVGVELRSGGMMVTTDASGNYQFTNFPNGTYAVTPSKDAWVFSPASKTVTINSASVSGNNFARATPNTLSGTITGIPASSQSPAPTVYLSNGQSVQATRQGSSPNRYWGYTMNVPAGQYSLGATLAGYTIVPATFSNPLTVAGNLTSLNFSGAASGTVGAITGRITQLGQPVVNASLQVSQSGVPVASVTSDSDGGYRIDNLTNGNYTVAANKLGLTFSPASIAITSVPSSGNNFTAAGTSAPPVISSVAASPSVVSSSAGTTTLSATASGAGPLTYSWSAVSAPAPVTFSTNDSGAATDTTVSFQTPGSYTFRIAVTDSNYFRTTATTTVTVNAGPGTMVVVPYQDQISVGQSLAFRADAWDQLGNRISVTPAWSVAGGGTMGTNGLFSATAPGGPYPVTATAGSLSATSFVWVAASSSAIPPVITTQPSSQAVAAGSEVTFSSAATGTDPIAFQWQRNSNNISGANASSYTLTNVQPADAGAYTVVVSNIAGSATSAAAILSVNSQPVLAAVADRTIHAGSSITISNSATDPDLPPQLLTFSLDSGAPAAASIGAADGVFVWHTTVADAGSTNPITVRVTDNGIPALADTQSFVITVVAPLLIQSASISNGLFTLTWNAIPGTTYRVQRTDDLSSGQWTSLEPDIVAPGSTASVVEPVVTDQAYYRILIIQ